MYLLNSWIHFWKFLLFPLLDCPTTRNYQPFFPLCITHFHILMTHLSDNLFTLQIGYIFLLPLKIKWKHIRLFLTTYAKTGFVCLFVISNLRHGKQDIWVWNTTKGKQKSWFSLPYLEKETLFQVIICIDENLVGGYATCVQTENTGRCPPYFLVQNPTSEPRIHVSGLNGHLQ